MSIVAGLKEKPGMLNSVVKGTLRGFSALAFTFRIYPKRNLVSVRWIRAASSEDWFDVLEQIIEHPLYRRGMNFITSRRGLTSGVSPDQVREILNVFEVRAGRITPASLAIVASADYDFGVARMMESLSETAQIVVRAFRRPRDAVEWLKNPIRFEFGAPRPQRDCSFVGEQGLFRAWVALT
jgi:hypothetical protein